MKIQKTLLSYLTKIKMKKLLFITLLLCSFIGTAQDKDAHREKIKALKTAYITEGMNFSPKEAQQFWPIYNDFQEKRITLYRRERADIENLECMSEEDANKKLQEYVDIEKEDYLLTKKYFEDLKKIFSAKKIMQLKKIEEDFNRKLMREYRARREETQK